MNPHITDEEKILFISELEKCTEYFEFGIGGSTDLALKYSNIKLVTGVDSDPTWVRKLNTMYPRERRLKLQFCKIGKLSTWGRPLNDALKRYWPNYPKSIYRLANKPDLIFIDGRFRVACAAQTALFCIDRKISPTIMLHDCEREKYKPIYEILIPMQKINELQIFAINPNVDIPLVKKIFEDYKFDWW